MALDEIKLDDLTWDDMVAAARRRMVAASDGRWTLHAPVDPGVTLVELLAWSLEQRLYWLDQVPDGLVHAALALLGERARPARAAETVLHVGAVDSAGAAVALPRDTEFRLQGIAKAPVVFSTTADVTLLPLAQHQPAARQNRSDRIGLVIGGRDRTADLESGRVMRLFPSDGSTAEVQITLWLTATLPTLDRGTAPRPPLTLLVELDTAGDVPPQWDPDAPANVPPPARLTWLYRNAPGAPPVPWPATVDDGTGGLRRSGVVALPVPNDWQPEGPPAAPGEAIAYAIWVRVDRATFTYPPRVRRLVPNVALARHARLTQAHPLKLDWRPLPGNTIALAELPRRGADADLPPLEGTVRLRIRERDGEHTWRRVSSLDFAGPADRVYVVDRDAGRIRFGDGLNGRLPVPVKLDPTNRDDSNGTLQFRVGGGAAGRVGAGQAWAGTVPGAGVTGAVNLVASVGGEESERPAAARDRASAAMRRVERAVTARDYETLAETVPGVAVARARAAVGVHPCHPCRVVPGAVTVFVVPHAPRDDASDYAADGAAAESAFVPAPDPDPGALAAIRASLDRRRLVGSEVLIAAPRYRPVEITVRLEGDPAGLGGVRDRLTARLRRFLDPINGGADGGGRPFGEPLSPSVLVRVAQQEAGEAARVAGVAIRLTDRDAPAEDCADVALDPHDLAFLEDLHVEVDPSRPQEGGLQ